jgi:hypothetical protein
MNTFDMGMNRKHFVKTAAMAAGAIGLSRFGMGATPAGEAELAQLGFAKVLVNTGIRKIHDDGVMAHLIRGPYIMFFQPMMEEPGWRSKLS